MFKRRRLMTRSQAEVDVSHLMARRRGPSEQETMTWDELANRIYGPRPKKSVPKTPAEREISALKAQLDAARKDLKEARQSVTYYREQCEQFRSENQYLRKLSAQTPRQNPGPMQLKHLKK